MNVETSSIRKQTADFMVHGAFDRLLCHQLK